jgi:DNA modification methylase
LEQHPQQLSLFASDEATTGSQRADEAIADYGTFKDSLRAPIHNWFRYPAGYSYKLVEQVFKDNQLQTGSWVYDPFSGTGTTLICAKQYGLHGYGVEAHAFVHWVASVKLFWEYDYSLLHQQIDEQLQQIQKHLSQPLETEGVFPELVYKCYHPQTLQVLYTIREAILNLAISEAIRALLKLALTNVLRESAAAGTGWPYIAPNKNTGDKLPKDAWRLFMTTVHQMVGHLYQVGRHLRHSTVNNILGDSRQPQMLHDAQINLALTSPPYLNNYDYADRTRLETYFWGLAHSWSDITTLYRNKLITAATTQVIRKHHDIETVLSPHIRTMNSSLYAGIQTAVQELAVRRLGKGGKKDYDFMVALYFNDLLLVLKETHRVLAPNAKFYLVLGDSAPYGVHIPTEQWVGELGLALGFRHMEYREFRQRGGKWKDNPQRHTVALREGLLILTK